MRLSRRAYATRSQKTLDFVLGFLGWFVVNGLIGVLAPFGLAGAALASGALDGGGSGVPDAVLTALGFAALCAPLFVNLAALAVLALTRYWMAFGALAALAVALPAGLCLAVAFGLAAFVPV